MERATQFAHPTARQAEVLRLIERGFSNQEVADALGISLAGAKWHVSELIGKFGVDSRDELPDAWAAMRRTRRRAWVASLFTLAPLKLAAGSAASAVVIGGFLMASSLGADGDETLDEPIVALAPAPTPYSPRAIMNYPDRSVRVIDESNITQGQAAALADGHITREEYEDGTWAAFECLKDAGREPLGEPSWDSSGLRLTFAFVAGGDRDETEDCLAAHLTLVGIRWGVQTTPSASQTAQAWSALRECIAAGGAPEGAADFETLHELAEYTGEHGFHDLFRQCGRQVAADFAMAGWAF